MHRLVATLISLLTGIGGHYLNRRWDRAALFMGLLFVWTLVGFAIVNLLSYHMTPQDIAGPGTAIRPWIYLLESGFASIILASALVTWRDARPSLRVEVPWHGAWSTLGAVLTTFMTLALLGYVALVGSVYLSVVGSIGPEATSGDIAPAADAALPNDFEGGIAAHGKPNSAAWFWSAVYFGGEPPYDTMARPLPSGDASVTGVVRYQAAPVVGARLKLMLNGEFASTDLTTDAQGRFTLRLPAGEWYVNSLRMDRWLGKPVNGEFMLVSVGKGAETAGAEDRHIRFPSGLPLTARTGSSADPAPDPALVIDIRPHVRLIWPSAQQQKAPAQLVDGVLRWDAYPGAARYRVELSEVERQANSASYYSVVTRTVEDARLPLSGLASVTGDTVSREYSVKVTALDANGGFLSETQHAFDGGSFTLTDGRRLLKEGMAVLLGAGRSPEDIQHLLKNDERLDAVVVLVREGMLDAAESMLAKIDTASPGRIAAVTGYLRATQGRCDAATALFKQARDQGGQVCVASEYWAGCPRATSP